MLRGHLPTESLPSCSELLGAGVGAQGSPSPQQPSHLPSPNPFGGLSMGHGLLSKFIL